MNYLRARTIVLARGHDMQDKSPISMRITDRVISTEESSPAPLDQEQHQEQLRSISGLYVAREHVSASAHVLRSSTEICTSFFRRKDPCLLSASPTKCGGSVTGPEPLVRSICSSNYGSLLVLPVHKCCKIISLLSEFFCVHLS